MTNLTKNKITINAIINFIHEAMRRNMIVFIPSFSCYNYSFAVDKGKDLIKFFVDDENGIIAISSIDRGYISVNININERDSIDLKTLALDIKEYNEEKVLNSFNNFFNDIAEKPTNIDDLNDDED